MNKLEIIRKVLNSDYQDHTSIMQEACKEVQMKITIKTYNRFEYALYKFCPSKYKADHFSEVGGLRKMCDYFLFVQKEDFLYIFIIELKKTSGSSAEKQLLAGECFVNYIIESASRIGESFNLSNCVIRKIKMKQQNKRAIKHQVNFVDGYCEDYCFEKFDIDYMLKRA